MTSLAGLKIGFIGAGAMAEALAGGLLASGVERAGLRASDVDGVRRAAFSERLGVATTASNAELLPASDVLVLAVKPAAMARVLGGLADVAERSRPLWISIAAGVPLATIERGLGAPARIVRAMPNTPALIRAGATAICGNERAEDPDLAIAEALFASVGITWRAPHEGLLDAVTGLSGSGPAYLFAFLEALISAGERVGLPSDAAQRLATWTVAGAARLALEDGRSPAELRAQVSSPGGTTVAGLAQLEAAGFGRAIEAAVRAASERSRELGRAASDPKEATR